MRKTELEKIWNWLEPQITPELEKWLKKQWPRIWCDIPEGSKALWHAKHVNTIYQLSFRIQEVLDAMKNRVPKLTLFGDGLPKSYLVEIAQMLNIDVKGKLKLKLIELVLDKIEKESN